MMSEDQFWSRDDDHDFDSCKPAGEIHASGRIKLSEEVETAPKATTEPEKIEFYGDTHIARDTADGPPTSDARLKEAIDNLEDTDGYWAGVLVTICRIREDIDTSWFEDPVTDMDVGRLQTRARAALRPSKTSWESNITTFSSMTVAGSTTGSDGQSK